MEYGQHPTRNENLLAQDDLLWTSEGRKRILALMDQAAFHPRQPTPEMQRAGIEWYQANATGDWVPTTVINIWMAMYDAAPPKVT